MTLWELQPMRRSKKSGKRCLDCIQGYAAQFSAPDWHLQLLDPVYRYIRLAKETHPDTGGDAVVFQDVLLAYRILSDEERRKEYDQTGEDAGDVAEEERKVRVADLSTLRAAVDNHRPAMLAI